MMQHDANDATWCNNCCFWSSSRRVVSVSFRCQKHQKASPNIRKPAAQGGMDFPTGASANSNLAFVKGWVMLSDAEWCFCILPTSMSVNDSTSVFFNMWNYVKRLCFMLMFQKLRSELELFRLCFESIVSICFDGADDTKASQSPVDAMPASPTGHHDAMGNSERIRKDPKGSQRVAVCKCL